MSGLVEEGNARVMAFPSSSVESCLSPYSSGREPCVREGESQVYFNGMPSQFHKSDSYAGKYKGGGINCT